MFMSASEGFEKIHAKAETQNISEAPKHILSSETYGSKVMNLRGRFENERSRLGPDFTESDRQWRIKWLQSQALHPNEPYDVPQLRKVNIFRRILRFPLEPFEDFLKKFVVSAFVFRFFLSFLN